MKVGIKIKTFVGIAIAFIFALLSFFEIIDYNFNYLEYERVYHIGSEGVEWKYQSRQNFIAWNIGLIIIAVLYIIVNLFFLFRLKENKFLKFIILCVEIIFLIWIIWFLYEWYLIDFDH